MNPERWREITEVFHAARARDAGARVAFLDEACAGDAALRAEVDAMLSADVDAAEFGRTPVAVFAEETPRLEAGAMLGSYRIEALIGTGGMGEVYRARDLRLGRDVAIKVLSELFLQDSERRTRLEHEARLLAALNHPRIAAIYDLEQVEGAPALVLELIEGPTLADRLAEGPLPIREALILARQVVEALEAAHQKGIVHRDLKPANIKLAREGAKVLDFGLAKVASPTTPGLTHARLATLDRTREGAILGTAGYMSPEQARGQPVDERTDIWALGCVLYEMLTGRRAFAGETLSDTIAAVLGEEPDWTALPSRTPLHLRTLLRRCLQKDPDRRQADLGGVYRVIDRCLTGGATPDWIVGLLLEWATGKHGVRWAAAALALVAGLFAYRWLNSDASVPRLTNPRQVTVAIGVEGYPSWSADGQSVAYESNQTGNWDIWVAGAAGGMPQDRTGDHRGDDRYPSWSPDGRQIAFWSARDGGGYFVMPAAGGVAVRVASTPGTAAAQHSPPEWSSDGTRLAYVSYRPAGRALEASLEVTTIATHEMQRRKLPGRQEGRLDLSWSGDGRYLAYVDAALPWAETTQLLVLRLTDGSTVEVTDARANVRGPRWSPDGRFLYFTSNQAGSSDLWRQRLDGNGHPLGEAQRITAGLEMQHASFSRNAARLAYSKGRWLSNVWRVPIQDDRPATWADAAQITFERAFIEMLDVSRDGRRIAFSSDRAGNQDLWTMPVNGGEAVRLTDDPAPDWDPKWSPDGREIVFYSNRTGDRELWVMPAEGGPARQLTSSPGLDAGGTWSPDGKEISFRSERRGSSNIWVTSSDGRRLRQITYGPAIDYYSAWSRDGRWLAYTSNRGGKRLIWRVPSAGGEPEQMTRGESMGFVWSVDGTKIFFVGEGDRAGNLWSLSLKTRRERPVTDLRGRSGKLGATSPATDGRYLYFPWREDVGDLWVVDVVAR